MFKHFILAIFCLIVSNSFVFGATVDINSEVYESSSIFTYNFNFDEEDAYRTFSFEKPRDAKIDFVVDGDGNKVKYSVAGDYFIIQPSEIQNSQFRIQFSSQSVSKEIKSKGKYSVYVNFNFPVEQLTYEVEIVDDFTEIVGFFPRGYQVSDTGSFLWRINNVESDTLFLIEFENTGLTSQDLWGINIMIIAGMVIIILIALAMIFTFFVLPKRRRVITKATEEKIIEKSVKAVQEANKTTVEASKKETYDEIVEKYLTDNEKEIVEIVRENPGITQYDILNYAPKLTKSNLSKIITKLNGKKILNRIRVGKINKIYLGERLEQISKE